LLANVKRDEITKACPAYRTAVPRPRDEGGSAAEWIDNQA